MKYKFSKIEKFDDLRHLLKILNEKHERHWAEKDETIADDLAEDISDYYDGLFEVTDELLSKIGKKILKLFNKASGNDFTSFKGFDLSNHGLFLICSETEDLDTDLGSILIQCEIEDILNDKCQMVENKNYISDYILRGK